MYERLPLSVEPGQDNLARDVPLPSTGALKDVETDQARPVESGRSGAVACWRIDGVRIPRDGGHDSMLMADSVPAWWRTPFHAEGGQHSKLMADTCGVFW